MQGTQVNSTTLEFTARVQIKGWSATGSGVVTQGQVQNEAITKYLSSSVTTAGDIAALQFDNLEIGAEYEVQGKAWFTVEAASTVRFGLFSGASSTGTQYIGVDYRDKEATSGGVINLADQPFSNTFIAESSTMYAYFDNFGNTDNAIAGNGTLYRTFVTLKKQNPEVAVIVPKQDGPKTFVKATGNLGTSLTANVTNINFINEQHDDNNEWDGNTFIAKESGTYTFKGSVLFTSSTGAGLSLYINGTQDIQVGGGNTADFAHNFSGTVRVNAGDLVQLRSSQNAQLSNNSVSHNLSITREDVYGDNIISSGPILTPITTGQEYETGEIIDGKKVYARRLSFTGSTTTTISFPAIDTGLEILELSGVYKRSNDWYSVNTDIESSGSRRKSFRYDANVGVPAIIFWDTENINVTEARVLIKYLKP